MEAPGYLSDSAKIDGANQTAGGTTAVDSTGYDMTGFDGILFIITLGTAAANNSVSAQESNDNGNTDAYANVGSAVISGTGKVLIVDVQKPAKRWVRAEVTRGTSSTVDSIVAIQYVARNLPVTQPANSILGQAQGV